MEKISVLELTGAQQNDSAYKNKFIRECGTEYVGVLDGTKFTGEELKCFARAEDMFSCGEIFVVCAGETQMGVQLPLEDMLECFSLQIVGLVFQKNILERVGKYNTKLQGMTDYEFLCRLLETGVQCICVFPGIAEDPLTVSAEDVTTLAYMMRRYARQLHARNKTEMLVQQILFVAKQCGVDRIFTEMLQKFIENEEYYHRVGADTAPYTIFRGDSTCHGVVQDFTDCITAYLRENGEACILVEGGKTNYNQLAEGVHKAIIGFQARALELKFVQALRGPKLQFWLDNPVFYENTFADLPEDCHVLCHDSNYADYIKRYFHKENVHLMPPAGHYQEWCENAERPYDIVFIGKYYPEPDVPLEGLYKQYYEFMLQHPEMTFSAGLKRLLRETGKEAWSDRITEIFRDMNPLCQRIINHYKKRVIETILGAGYEVHVYGDSWDKYQSPHAHQLIKHPQVTVEESLKEWQKAKIGLNIMSWHKAGMTERIANIMLSGAVCLSDETTYLNKHFVEGEQIVTFKLECLGELPDKIEHLLKVDNWKQIAREGYEIAAKEHTWEQRTQQLIDLVEEIWDN